ncbi:MAG: hypothetical protein ABL955_13665 [Elusimicrobiota bacterium]
MKYSSIIASVICVLAGAPMALAQAAPNYTPPKTSWGVPDLQGFFTKASLTTMTRPAGATGLIVTQEERNKLFNGNIYTRVAKEEAALSEAKLLTDANPDRAYNRFWMDPGADLGKIDGKYRSSWIVEPANGQIPYIKGPTNVRGLTADEEEYADRPSDNPEERGVGERCVYHGSGGPPLQNQMYNNVVQIVQSPTHVMILTEQIHEARIVNISATHGPADVPKWGGDSIGHYEGNTLVVETTNVEPKQGGLISSKGKITERFTRANDGQLLYEYAIDDPTRYTQVWKAEMPLNVSEQPTYEYACHEGNYSMFNTLSGARSYEREGRKNGMRKAIFAGVAEAKE